MIQTLSYKKIAALTLPLILAQSSVLLNALTDLAFIGPLGANAIAAVSIANAICATLLNFLEGFRLGSTVLIARASAQSSDERVSSAVSASLVLAAAVGFAAFLGAAPVSSAVYTLCGDSSLSQHGADYLKIWLWAIGPILLLYVLTGFFRGLGDTVTPLYATAIVVLTNIGLDYLLIAGNLGFPALGAAGAAVGTLVANLAGVILLLGLAFHQSRTRKFLRRQWPSSGQFAEFVSLAIDVGLNTGFTLLALLCFVALLQPLGPVALAAHQITLQLFNFTYLPSVGFLIAASILTPQLLARNQLAAVRAAAFRIGKMSLGCACLVSGLLWLFAPEISRFFSPADHRVAVETIRTLRLVCIAQLFSSIYMVLRGTLTGCRDTRFLVGEGLVSGYLLFLPLAWLLAVKFQGGVFGGYTAFLLWCAFDCLALAWHCRSQLRSSRRHTAPQSESSGPAGAE